MQQRIRRLALVLGSSILGSIGVLAACSTEVVQQLPSSPTTTKDSGTTRRDAGADDGDGDTDPQGASDAGGDCGKAPKPKPNTSIFCRKDVEGKTLYCKPGEGEMCCSEAKMGTKFVPGSCQRPLGETCTFPSGYAGGIAMHCTDGTQCPTAGNVCCLTPGDAGAPKAFPDTLNFPGCGVVFVSSLDFTKGTRCKAACGATDLQLCSSDAECTRGKCIGATIINRSTGVCQ